MTIPARWFMWLPAFFNAFWAVLFGYSFWVGAFSGDPFRCIVTASLFVLSAASFFACGMAATGRT